TGVLSPMISPTKATLAVCLSTHFGLVRLAGQLQELVSQFTEAHHRRTGEIEHLVEESLPVVVLETSDPSSVQLQEAPADPFRKGRVGKRRVIYGFAGRREDFLARGIYIFVRLGMIAVPGYLASRLDSFHMSNFSCWSNGGSLVNS